MGLAVGSGFGLGLGLGEGLVLNVLGIKWEVAQKEGRLEVALEPLPRGHNAVIREGAHVGHTLGPHRVLGLGLGLGFEDEGMR